ncbi:hypothetical protein [Borreliella bavariensis]
MGTNAIAKIVTILLLLIPSSFLIRIYKKTYLQHHSWY